MLPRAHIPGTVKNYTNIAREHGGRDTADITPAGGPAGPEYLYRIRITKTIAAAGIYPGFPPSRHERRPATPERAGTVSGARLSHAIYGRDVDAVYAAGADENARHRHALADEPVEPAQHELEGRRPIAQRPGRVFRHGTGLLDPLRGGRVRQGPVAPLLGARHPTMRTRVFAGNSPGPSLGMIWTLAMVSGVSSAFPAGKPFDFRMSATRSL